MTRSGWNERGSASAGDSRSFDIEVIMALRDSDKVQDRTVEGGGMGRNEETMVMMRTRIIVMMCYIASAVPRHTCTVPVFD